MNDQNAASRLLNRAPLLGALVPALVVGGLCWTAVADAAARGAHTAQAVGIGIGIVFTAVAAAIGGALGSAAKRAAADGENGRAAALVLIGAAGLGWFCVRTTLNRRENARLDAIRAEALTPERARALTGGTRDEVIALAYNPTCPPALLLELSKNADRSVRAAVGGNMGAPEEITRALLKDADEAVRLYAQNTLDRRRAAERPSK